MLGYFDLAQKIINADENGNQVWMCGRKFAQNQQNILSNKFVLVIACMPTQFRFNSPSISHLRFPIENDQHFDIKGYFEPSLEAIDLGRKSGKVLLYSELGISRSATIAVAYLMQRYGIKWKDALETIKKGRFCAQPNQNFIKQLDWFGKFVVRNKQI